MFTTLEYAGKSIKLHAYSTLQEKEILLCNELNEVPNVNDILEILSDNISVDVSELSYSEKCAVLLKLRSLSIGEEIAVKWNCQSCTIHNDGNINVSDIVQENSSTKYKFVDEDVTDVNLHKFTDYTEAELEDMTLKEFNALKEDVQVNKVKFNFNKILHCHKCNTEQIIDVSRTEYVCDSLSEDTILSLYQSTADLVFHGRYTKLDIDSMLPFERSIFIGILNKTKEDLAT